MRFKSAPEHLGICHLVNSSAIYPLRVYPSVQINVAENEPTIGYLLTVCAIQGVQRVSTPQGRLRWEVRRLKSRIPVLEQTFLQDKPDAREPHSSRTTVVISRNGQRRKYSAAPISLHRITVGAYRIQLSPSRSPWK